MLVLATLVVIKAQPKTPWMRAGGHLVILFFSIFMEPSIHWGVSILQEYFCQWYMGLKICIIYFACFYAVYFSAILLLHVREPYGKLYAQNHIASCNGCSHQSNHIEKTCSIKFVITHPG